MFFYLEKPMLIVLVTVINDFPLIEKQIKQNIGTFGGVHILRSANYSLCAIMKFNPRTFFTREKWCFSIALPK